MLVAASGDYGKPRPAVVVQTDAMPLAHPSVVVCQMTSDLADAGDFRVNIQPSPANGLRLLSQVMADKPVTIRREKIVTVIGKLDDADTGRVGTALAFVLGYGD
ncbi:type II toxin-antitoxin system PemK/MazF family toxin [Phreatobacter sp.]|uniref:type II toxin-antitoxin system PemK/MazF family toxin n=1 Tax=Phreatobacter sp. TaxID=1966341 RepID=UPI003523AA33